MKNKLIKEFRERLSSVSNELKEITNYIEKNKVMIDNFHNKYFEMRRVKDYLDYIITNKNLDNLSVKSIFLYTKNGDKFHPLNSHNISANKLKKILSDVKKDFNYFQEMTIKLCEIVQLHLKKLELIEDIYFKVFYSIEYLELGDDAIHINNQIGYSYYFIIYFNSLSGFESSHSKLKSVHFNKEDIDKFIYESSNN